MELKNKPNELPEWEQEHAGIALNTLLYHIDQCLSTKRMTVPDTQRYVMINIIQNPLSTLTLQHHKLQPNFLLITYLYQDEDGVEQMSGFSVPIKSIYSLLCRVNVANRKEQKADGKATKK